MSALDVVLAAGLALGVWRGLRTGALVQAVAAGGTLLAFVVAVAVMEPLGDSVAASLGASPRVAPVLGFVVAFAAVAGGLVALAQAGRKTLRKVRLGGLDAAAGAGVGGLRAAFSMSVLLLVVGVSPGGDGEPWLGSAQGRRASVLHAPVAAVAPAVWDAARAATPGVQDRARALFASWTEAQDAEPRAAR